MCVWLRARSTTTTPFYPLQCPPPLTLANPAPARALGEQAPSTAACRGELDAAARADYGRFRAAVVAASTEAELRAAVRMEDGERGWWAWVVGG